VEAVLASAEDPERSVQLWTEYASLYPDLGSGQNNAALVLWQDLNRCPEAIPLFDQALNSRDPKRFVAGHYKGYCQLWGGDAPAAEEAFKAGIGFNPRPVTFGLSDVYSFQERFAEAEAAQQIDGSSVGAVYAFETRTRSITSLAYQGRLTEARAVAQALINSATVPGLAGTVSRAQIYNAALALIEQQPIALESGAASMIAHLGPDESPHYPVTLRLAVYALSPTVVHSHKICS